MHFRAEGLKGRFQLIQARHKGLIGGQAREKFAPVPGDELMDRFFLKEPMEMSEEIDRQQFLIGNADSLRVVAEALKARLASGIVQFTDQHIEANEFDCHSRPLLLVPLACL